MTGLLLQLGKGEHHLQGENGRGDKPPREATVIQLTADQLLHPERPGDYLLRLGRLRVSGLLPDGRELTLAVLHAGEAIIATADDSREANPAHYLYRMDHTIMMALDETEVWVLPGGALAAGRR